MLIRCYSPPGQLHYALSLSCYGYIPEIIMNPADPGGAPWPLSSLGNGLYSCRNRHLVHFWGTFAQRLPPVYRVLMPYSMLLHRVSFQAKYTGFSAMCEIHVFGPMLHQHLRMLQSNTMQHDSQTISQTFSQIFSQTLRVRRFMALGCGGRRGARVPHI